MAEQKMSSQVLMVFSIFAIVMSLICIIMISFYLWEWWVQKPAHTQEIELRLDRLEAE